MRGIEKLGWRRTDRRPWRSKLDARWAHPSGWRLYHCGHPTANWPWDLYNPFREQVRTGVLSEFKDPRRGLAWRTLELVADFVAKVEAGEEPMPRLRRRA